MGRRIVIDAVTRIEGHAKISLLLDDQGEVSDARFHVVEFRGFEKFCEGRSFREMPAITSRICGICPVSHMLTSAKAGDELLAVEIPEGATRLRRLLHYGQIVQSHALSFFHLSAPDFLLGHDSDPARRNVVGLIAANPELARRGIALRRFGQEIIETLAGKRIHSTWVVPGGVDEPLTAAGRDRIRAGLPEAKEATRKTLTFWKREMERHADEARVFGNFPTLFMGLVTPDGGLELYDGRLRFVDATGGVVADQIDPSAWHEHIGEAVEPWSYLKFPYYKPLGYPAGMYRVGPLARLNVASHCGTELADRELAEFRQLGRGAVLSAFHYHYARLVEALHCLERIEELLAHPDLLTPHVMAFARRNRYHGVGAIEAPRGTLFHDYEVRQGGLISRANLVIATGQNNLALNQTVLQIARHYVKGAKVQDGMLNRIEAGIRAYDPCLSCSTHAMGRMPLAVELVAPDGAVLGAVARR
jgi:NAD-reducing hydrogenase large subunit